MYHSISTVCLLFAVYPGMSGDGGQPDPLGVQADPAGPVPEFF